MSCELRRGQVGTMLEQQETQDTFAVFCAALGLLGHVSTYVT